MRASCSQGFRNDSPKLTAFGPRGALNRLGERPGAGLRDGRQAGFAAPDGLLRFAAQPVPPELAAHCLPSDVPLALLRCGSRRASSRSPTACSSCASASSRTRSNVDSHEPELSSDELAWGRHFLVR